MNKDPLEELFGTPDETPEPVPARERLAYEQADRVRTAQFPAERGAVGRAQSEAPSSRAQAAKPWIIVGVVAVLAIIGAIVVLNMARGQEAPAPTASPTTTPTTSQQTTPPTTPSTQPTEKPETEKPDDEVPSVEVGDTIVFPIGPWNATSQWPQRLGGASFEIPTQTDLRLSGELFNSFPAECEAMRTQWGATKLADGSFEVAKPATKCAAAPELYDEVWGLLDAWVKTIKVG
ncbi:hypothetical protein EDF60_0596 [Leucobacter luti]|uniref:Uncharacterized protein n=1 Tax=Leucobacter luti TaxID=340320 RepID=A0A4R6S7K3_9MICO|nr:hypothetical protein [Leucobacter luti]MCW2288474.1 hypothetical protein [Leucobacter luti]TCK45370.1 hypothetical protein EDF60_0596 [Leucobacter luti]TDP95899.1 hypothetical protein EDF62_0593 [Leucobacter luti]